MFVNLWISGAWFSQLAIFDYTCNMLYLVGYRHVPYGILIFANNRIMYFMADLCILGGSVINLTWPGVPFYVNS